MWPEQQKYRLNGVTVCAQCNGRWTTGKPAKHDADCPIQLALENDRLRSQVQQLLEVIERLEEKTYGK